MMRAITAYELTHVGFDRFGLQFKRTRLKTIGRVCHGRQPVVWTALEAGSRKNKWPEESRNPVCAPRGERGCRASRRGGVEGKDVCRGSRLGRKVYILRRRCKGRCHHAQKRPRDLVHSSLLFPLSVSLHLWIILQSRTCNPLANRFARRTTTVFTRQKLLKVFDTKTPRV